MMDVFILLTLLHILSLNAAYNFTCPSQAHWNIRANSMCKPPRNYTCLFNITFRVNVYKDRCNRPRILAPGYKYVFQPNLNRATCSVNRYQPFNFDTMGYSDCTFKKSLCSSLGQETYEDGNTTVDRKCICNTNKGYTFVRKLQNQSYCNPSTEDCSCYLGINSCNETVGLKDIKCYNWKITRKSYFGNMLNITRTIQISEFDNFKYNIYRVPTKKYRIDAAYLVFTLFLSYFVVWIIVVGIGRQWMKKRSKNLLKLNEVVSTKNENRYFVRIMIVGKESAGKTSLLRRLLNEGISDVSSTDGVDIIVRRCKINIENGKWTIGKEIDDMNERINRALSPNAKRKTFATEGNNRKQKSATPMPFGEKESTASNDFPIDIAPDECSEDTASQIMPEDETKSRTISHFDDMSSYKIHRTTDIKENLDKNEPSLLLLPKNLMSEVYSKLNVKTERNLYALCELWDFAGQKEFYATHQAFLTSSAVYLVVADMENDIIKQDKSKFSADYQHIGDYIDFWFDSIHCHRTVDEQASHGHYDPPILLVFTGKDKYNKADLQKRKKELNEQIDQVLGNQSKYHHLHDTFYLSNKADTDKEFDKFRFAIFETARKKNSWGEAFPLKWFLLEHLIQINKNNGKNFIILTDMFQLAKHPDIKILKKIDLLLFLRFQHNVGNIIFFESIPDLIIINPQWLADAFRCLVSDRVDDSRLHHLADWTLFTRQGKISESLITELFNSKDGSQFSEQKNNLHKVMEKFDILVKIENSNYYIMPSKMPSSTLDDVCEKFGILTKKCKRSSWLCFKFEFLPPSFFNHLSAWFIRKYDPSKLDVGIALYRGICMFDIEGSGCKKILVTMSTDTIALQVISFSEQEGFGNTCTEIYYEVKQLIEDIKERYKVNISFKLHFKCSDGYYYKNTFEYEKLTRDKECFCFQHKKAHQSKEMYSSWTKKRVRIISHTAEISTEQDDHNPNTTIHTTSIDKIRSAKCSMVVLEVFPMIMQELMAQTEYPAKSLYDDIMGNASFRKKLNKSEFDMVDTLKTDEYTKINVRLSYKIIVNFFPFFITPPSRQWGANPIDTEIGIGDDIERIRQEQNRLVQRVIYNISEVMFDNFFVTFIEVGKRIDAYLNKTRNNGYAQTVRQYKTCVLNPEQLEKIEQLKEMCSLGIPKKEVRIFTAISTETVLEKIREEAEGSNTKLKINIFGVFDSDEMVEKMNSLKDDLNIDKIYVNGDELDRERGILKSQQLTSRTTPQEKTLLGDVKPVVVNFEVKD